MASKASFSPDEWTKVLQSVMMAGIAVTAAEPSGLWGTLKESMTAGHALLEAKSDTKSSQLIKAVVADFETSEGRVHSAYNLGNVDAIESNMFVGPPGRPITVLIPGDERRCGPPSTVAECMGHGWTAFNHPTTFANQGACIAYVRHRPTITVLVPEDPLR